MKSTGHERNRKEKFYFILLYFIFKSRIEDVNMMLNMVDVQVSEMLSGVVMWTREKTVDPDDFGDSDKSGKENHGAALELPERKLKKLDHGKGDEDDAM